MSPSQLLLDKTQSASKVSTTTQIPSLNESKKPPYQAAVQVKFLHLEAEVDSLLQELQLLKQRRQTAANCDAGEKRH